MKELLEKLAELDRIDESVDPTPADVKRIDEMASMNISMSGENADEVARLVQIMRGTGSDAKPVDMDMINPSMDKLRAIVGPKEPDMISPMDKGMDQDELKPGIQKEPCSVCGKVHLGNSSCNDSIDNDDEALEVSANEGGMSDVMIGVDELLADYTNGDEKESGLKMPKDEVIQAIKDSNADPMEIRFAIDTVKNDFDDEGNYKYAGYDEEVEEWDNSPDEEYKDHQYMTKDLSGGINREKKQYKAAQPGDNAMAMEQLQNELRDALMAKMSEGADMMPLPSAKEMKACDAKGMSKKQIMDKYSGCDRKKLEKLYASSCGGH